MTGTTLHLLADGLYRPPLPLVVVGLGLLLVVVLAAAASRREGRRLTVLPRLLGLAGLTWVLLGHSIVEPGKPSDDRPPRLDILVDTSRSMAERDSPPTPGDEPLSRLDLLRQTWLSTERLRELNRNADVRLIGFDEQARPLRVRQLTADGDATRLYDALNMADADITLILSDGHDTSGRTGLAADDPPTGNAGRIYAVPVGGSRSVPDVALQAWAQSDRLFEDQSTTITASLYQRGLTGREAVVELMRGGAVIDTRPIVLDAAAAELAFEVSPPLTPGRVTEAHHYAARVRVADYDESYTLNNAEDVFIQVSRERVRVLLIEGEPYWDTRALSRLIGTHPRFDLTAVFSFGDTRRSRILGEAFVDGAADPLDALARFDIVVLGRHVERLVRPGFAGELADFVRGGGAVVMARGRPIDPTGDNGIRLLAGLEPISPVAWAEPIVGEMRVRVGASGDDNPLASVGDDAVLSRLPGMLAATRIDGRKAASLVVLEQQPADGPAMAAVTTLRFGGGVVLAVLTEGLWRWELLPNHSADAQTQSVYGDFWVRALQWLASGGQFLPGQDIALELDRLSVQPGVPVQLRVSTRYIETDGLTPKLTVTDAQGNTRGLTLTRVGATGGFSAAFVPEATGVYRFTLTTPGRDDLIDPGSPLTTRLAVVDRSAEKRDTSARPEVLEQLAEPTGGKCLKLDEPGPLLEHLQLLQRTRDAADVVSYDFNTWPAFAWIAGCFGLEWFLRRRSGLR